VRTLMLSNSYTAPCHRCRRYVGLFLALAIVTVVHRNLRAQEKRDIVFVVDGSESIDGGDFEIERDGLRRAVRDDLLVPLDGTIAVGVVQFAYRNATLRTRREVQLTVVRSGADLDAIVEGITDMGQIKGGTNPSDGVDLAIEELRARGRPDAAWHICLLTDGVPNTGDCLVNGSDCIQETGDAVQAARDAGLDCFGVIGIECPGAFSEEIARSIYGPMLFGGCGLTFVSRFQELDIIGPTCFGDSLKLVGFEVIQAVQDWTNSVDLVEGKDTFVRAHLEPSDPQVEMAVATARLRGFRDGGELKDSPLTPFNQQLRTVVGHNAVERRGDFDASINFQLPFDWRMGTIELFLEGGQGIDCSEAAGTDDTCRTSVTFQPAAELELKLFRVEWEQGGMMYSPSDNDMNELEERLVSIFPIASVDSERVPLVYGGTVPPDPARVNAQLATIRFSEDEDDRCLPLEGCHRLHHGVLTGDPENDLGGFASGEPVAPVSSGMKIDENFGVYRIAHLLALNLELDHAPFCGAPTDEEAEEFPYTAMVTDDQGDSLQVATLGPLDGTDDQLIYGLDRNQNVIDPNHNYELMSYCGRFDAFANTGFDPSRARWVSRFTYDNLRDRIGPLFGGQGQGAGIGNVDSQLIVRGFVDFASNTVEFLPSFELEGPVPLVPDEGSYTLRLSDGAGTALTQRKFEPRPPRADATQRDGPSSSERGFFLVPVPADPAIRKIEVLDDGATVIGEISRSGQAPVTQTILAEAGTIPESGRFELSWETVDADGDALHHLVQYSPDGGSDWATLAVDWPSVSISIDAESLAGSDSGVFRILTSDGVDTAMDTSETFAVPNKPPSVVIRSPSREQTFFGTQLIHFEGTARDLEDGELSGGELVWSIDGTTLNGFPRSGNNFTEIATDLLSDGGFTVTLTATDTAGRSTSESVAIHVNTFPPRNFVRGDSNADGKLNVADPIYTLNYLFRDGPAITCMAAADANGADGVDMSDPMFTVYYLWLQGPPPVAPFPDCGARPSDECDSFSPCRG